MSDTPQYSDAAMEKQRIVEEKRDRGEQPTWSDLRGIWEPHPDLPDCQAWEGSDHKCDLTRGHEGPHRHVIEWGGGS